MKKQPFCQRLLFYKLAMLFLSVLFWGYYRNDFLLYQNRDHHEPQQRGIRPFQYCMGSGLCAPHCVSLSLQRKMTVISFLQERSLEELTNTYAVYFQSLCSVRYSGITAPFPLIWEAVSICCIVFLGDRGGGLAKDALSDTVGMD